MEERVPLKSSREDLCWQSAAQVPGWGVARLPKTVFQELEKERIIVPEEAAIFRTVRHLISNATLTRRKHKN